MKERIEYFSKTWWYILGQEYKEPGWYYWDEVWNLGDGPFETREECSEALTKYAESL